MQFFCTRARYLIGIIIWAKSSFISPTTILAQAEVAEPMPSTIAVCVDSDGCSNWSFQGNHGKAQWGNNSVSDLTVLRFDSTTVIIHSVDSVGSTKGIVADYKGIRHGFKIEGTSTITWPGHGDDVHPAWHAIIAPPLHYLKSSSTGETARPVRLQVWDRAFLFCESEEKDCDGDSPSFDNLWLLGLHQGESIYASTKDLGNHTELTIEQFEPNSIVIRRFDPSGFNRGMSAIYTGKMQGDLAQGTVEWMWPGHANKPFTGKWLARLLPDTCERLPAALANPASEMQIGSLAYLHNNQIATFECYQLAAQQGNSDAQNDLGRMYLEGAGTERNNIQAVHWFEKSQDQGNPAALMSLSLMHMKGIGYPVDLFQGELFLDWAHLTKANQVGFGEDLLKNRGPFDLFGEMRGYTYSDYDFANPHLAARVKHEEAVYELTNAGEQRVAAEEKVYAEEMRRRSLDYAKCLMELPSYTDKRQNESDAQAQSRHETNLRGLCSQETNDEIDKQSREYLQCVRKFVDSNKIQTNCTYFEKR